MKVNQAFTIFLQSKMANNASKRTIKTYQERLKTFLSEFGEIEIEDLTESNCEQWVLGLYRQRTRWKNHPYKPKKRGGLSEATIYGRITALKIFLKWAVDRRILTLSPAYHIRNKRPQLDRYKKRAMSLDTLAALLEGATHERDKAIIAFIAETGCRPSECANALLEDLELDKHQILIRKSKTGPGILTFTSETARYLRAWLKERPHSHSPHLFVGIHAPNIGNRISTSTIYQLFRRISENNGLEQELSSPRTMRAMVATRYANLSLNINDAQSKLRHTDPKTTMIYVEANLDRQKEVDNRLSAIKAIKGKKK